MADCSKSFRLKNIRHWPDPRSLATTSGVSVDVLSSGYLDVSVPQVRLSLLRYPCGWVAPFGDTRIKACSQLPMSYRSVPRPSSPLSAKASTECPSFTSSLSLSILTAVLAKLKLRTERLTFGKAKCGARSPQQTLPKFLSAEQSLLPDMLLTVCANHQIRQLTHHPVSIGILRGARSARGKIPCLSRPHALVRTMCGKTSSRDPIDDRAVKPATDTPNTLSRSDRHLSKCKPTNQRYG